MGWSGSDFQRSHNFSADASAGINILASRMDEEFDNFETGLEACLKVDGTNAPEADFEMAGYRHTNVGAAVSTNQYLRLDQLQKLTPIFAKFGGTAEAISASTTPSFTALVTGHTVLVSCPSANASSATLNVNAISAYPIRNADGTALANGAVKGLRQYVFTGSNWALLNTYQGGTVDATTNFTQAVTMSDDFTVSGSATFTGPVSVAGAATLGNVSVGGTLVVGGSTEFDSYFLVSGSAEFTDAVAFGGPVTFSSSASFAGDVSFTGTAANLIPVLTLLVTQEGATSVSAISRYPADVTVSAIGSTGAFEVNFPSGNGPGSTGVVVCTGTENTTGASGRVGMPYAVTSSSFRVKTRNLTGDATNTERMHIVAYKIV